MSGFLIFFFLRAEGDGMGTDKNWMLGCSSSSNISYFGNIGITGESSTFLPLPSIHPSFLIHRLHLIDPTFISTATSTLIPSYTCKTKGKYTVRPSTLLSALQVLQVLQFLTREPSLCM